MLFEPTPFFRSVANQRGSSSAQRFATICFSIGAPALCAAGLASWALPGDQGFPYMIPFGLDWVLTGLGSSEMPMWLSASLVLALASIAAAFLGSSAMGLLMGVAALSQVLSWYVMDRDEMGDYQATVRAAAYSLPLAALLFWVPVVNFLAFGYSLYLYVVGLREAHRTSTGRALLVVAVVFGVESLFFLMLFGAPGLLIMLVVLSPLLYFARSWFLMPVTVGITLFLILLGIIFYPPMALVVFILMILYLTFVYRT